ncbi:uncharacterized protein Ecym_2360 [Eremothecium cymbalariae DBVPG|uniref:Uncharacterized protein n=1 Tax=Eremothecium cymbalariae (strain CBS 270.75 / DBVPG 7215 / KCTC 17166 / NRRL Y-17582) TaxID=931890 RepID=G8JNM6_ERECY|nr:Hypothetical protein Ecym_2360 [Eremothecium cymbalariae DBVPG\
MPFRFYGEKIEYGTDFQTPPSLALTDDDFENIPDIIESGKSLVPSLGHCLSVTRSSTNLWRASTEIELRCPPVTYQFGGETKEDPTVGSRKDKLQKRHSLFGTLPPLPSILTRTGSQRVSSETKSFRVSIADFAKKSQASIRDKTAKRIPSLSGQKSISLYFPRESSSKSTLKFADVHTQTLPSSALSTPIELPEPIALPILNYNLHGGFKSPSPSRKLFSKTSGYMHWNHAITQEFNGYSLPPLTPEADGDNFTFENPIYANDNIYKGPSLTSSIHSEESYLKPLSLEPAQHAKAFYKNPSPNISETSFEQILKRYFPKSTDSS